MQSILHQSDEEITESTLHDWRAVLTIMSDGPLFFGAELTGIDAIAFSTLATTVLTPIER